MKKSFSRESQSGQAMLLAVLTIGATMLSATTIAGLLMLYQIRQTIDFGNSAKAVFAADAGTEWALYNNLVTSTSPLGFLNGASTTVVCDDSSNPPVPVCATSTAVYAISKGFSGGAERAFLETFSGATSTLP
jgi:hypothetical protein